MLVTVVVLEKKETSLFEIYLISFNMYVQPDMGTRSTK